MRIHIHRDARILLALAMLLACTGCKWLDDLVQEVMDTSGLNPSQHYTVSLIDMKVVADPKEPITTESKLSPILMESARQGVRDVKLSQKGKHIELVDRVPKALAPDFYDKVLGDKKTAKECRQYLSTLCKKHDTNILMWSLYVGDDAEIKYLAFLYRSDIDAIAASNPTLLKDKQSDVVKQEVAYKTTRDLLVKSLECPKWTDQGVTFVKEHKEETVWGMAALLALLQQWNNNEQ